MCVCGCGCASNTCIVTIATLCQSFHCDTAKILFVNWTHVPYLGYIAMLSDQLVDEVCEHANVIDWVCVTTLLLCACAYCALAYERQ